MCPTVPTANCTDCTCWDDLGHNYMGHNYIGRNYTGHGYMGHNCIDHNYTGHSCMRHNYMGHDYRWSTLVLFDITNATVSVETRIGWGDLREYPQDFWWLRLPRPRLHRS